MCQFEQYLSHRQNERRAHSSWATTKEPTMSCWRYTPRPKQDRFQDFLEAVFQTFSTQFYPNKIPIIVIPTYFNC